VNSDNNNVTDTVTSDNNNVTDQVTSHNEKVTSNFVLTEEMTSLGADGMLFEGDIMLSVKDLQEMTHNSVSSDDVRRRRRKVTYSPTKRWSLPIPYMFDTSAQYRLSE
jgi:hypothetical protein